MNLAVKLPGQARRGHDGSVQPRVTSAEQPARARQASALGVLLLAMMAAAAWAGVVAIAGPMTAITGAMGLSAGVFAAVWTLMMAAMMLPSISPAGARYAQAMRGRAAAGVTGLAIGYLAVWAAASVPGYGLARLAGWLGASHPSAARVLAVAVFAGCGLYQLSGPKRRCLERCRGSLDLLPHEGTRPRWTADLRAGARLGKYCVGSSVGLMLILFVAGLMNLAAMAGLAVVILAEKAWVRGQVARRVVGAAALALALAVVWLPWLAPGLRAAPAMHPMKTASAMVNRADGAVRSAVPARAA